MDVDISGLYREHIDHVQALYREIFERSKFKSIVLCAGDLKYRFKDDVNYPFKPSAYFVHWLPITDIQHCYLIINEGQKPILCFYQPHDFWHRVAADPEGYWTRFFDIKIIRTPQEVTQHLPKSLAETALLGEPDEVLREVEFAEVNPEKVIAFIDFNRARKTEYELHCMREATKIAVRGHEAARDAYFEGASAFEMHIAYLLATEQMEQDLPYHNIIGVNESCGILHNHELPRARLAAAERHSMLIDAGANYHGYAADISRTYAYHASSTFAEMVRAVDVLQQELCHEVKNGESFVATQQATHFKVAHFLQDFELIKLNPTDMVEQELTKAFFPHGVGHLLGLQVHDAGGWQSSPEGDLHAPPQEHNALRCTRELAPGHVVTIEPGIYFIELLLAEHRDNAAFNWPLINEMMKYGGIRIEDNVVIHEEHVENMTRDAGLA